MQFHRLPILNSSGIPYYLDMIMWRLNAGFELKKEGEIVGQHLFRLLCLEVREWTRNPLEDFDRRIELPEDAYTTEEKDGDFFDVISECDESFFDQCN